LQIDDSDILINYLLKSIKELGITYKVNKKDSDRIGLLPKIDIDEVEKKIHELESKNSIASENESLFNLLDLYQNAIEFYSASNNSKYGEYLDKLHQLLSPQSPQKQITGSNEIILKNQNFILEKDENRKDTEIDIKTEEKYEENEKKSFNSNESNKYPVERMAKQQIESENKINEVKLSSGIVIDSSSDNQFLKNFENSKDEEEEEESNK